MKSKSLSRSTSRLLDAQDAKSSRGILTKQKGMNKRAKIFIIIAVIILILSVVLLGIVNTSYTIFVEEEKGQGGQCVSTYQNCRCFGILMANFGKSDQYNCFGFNYCKEIKINKCG